MKASHLHTPRDMESAFGNGIQHCIAERPSRGRQMLRALLVSIGTVALTCLAIWLLTGMVGAR